MNGLPKTTAECCKCGTDAEWLDKNGFCVSCVDALRAVGYATSNIKRWLDASYKLMELFEKS